MSSNDIDRRAVDLVARYEGLRLVAYRDAVGIWTIGYGHTGSDVHEGMTITEARALELLQEDLAHAWRGVLAGVTGSATSSQLGAMASLAYNVGVAAFAGSTVLKRHNAGDFWRVPEAFTWWRKAGGRDLRGLLRRRCEEAALYCEDRW